MENNPSIKNLPSVSIIILNWNGIQDTRNCLYSLKWVSYTPINITVIDNGSKNNEAAQLKKEFGEQINIICEPKNAGFAEGNNIGIRLAIKAGMKYVCLLNNDTTVDPNFLHASVTVAESDESIAMVAPNMRTMKDPTITDNLGITLTLSGLSFNRKDDQWRLFCPTGGAVLYRVSALKRIAINNQFFDPTYFAYVEDLDLGFRLIWQGYRPEYASQSIVLHRGSGSTSVMSDFALFHSQRNLLLTWIKNLPSKYLVKYGWAMIIVQFAHAFLFIRRHKLLLLLKADLAALRLFPHALRMRKIILRNRKIGLTNMMALIEPRIVLMTYLRHALRSARSSQPPSEKGLKM